MDSIRRVLADRAARVHETLEIFTVQISSWGCSGLASHRKSEYLTRILQDLSATVKRYDYQYTPDDARAVKDCASGKSYVSQCPNVHLSVWIVVWVCGLWTECLARMNSAASQYKLYMCVFAEFRRLPMAELASGAVGGFLLGNLVKQR